MVKKVLITLTAALTGILFINNTIPKPEITTQQQLTLEHTYIQNLAHHARLIDNEQIQNTSEEQLTKTGNKVCEILNTPNKTLTDVLKNLQRKGYDKSNEENVQFIDAIVTKSIQHLCPQHLDWIKY